MLRHEIAVMRREVAAPARNWADRAVIAAAASRRSVTVRVLGALPWRSRCMAGSIVDGWPPGKE